MSNLQLVARVLEDGLSRGTISKPRRTPEGLRLDDPGKASVVSAAHGRARLVVVTGADRKRTLAFTLGKTTKLAKMGGGGHMSSPDVVALLHGQTSNVTYAGLARALDFVLYPHGPSPECLLKAMGLSGGGRVSFEDVACRPIDTNTIAGGAT